MASLSVNVNKVATLRNARGGAVPSVLEAVEVCIAAGAPGITVHPRADRRHITPDDVRAIVVTGAGRGFCPGADLDLLQGRGGGCSSLSASDRKPVTFPLTIRTPRLHVIIPRKTPPAMTSGTQPPCSIFTRLAARSARSMARKTPTRLPLRRRDQRQRHAQ